MCVALGEGDDLYLCSARRNFEEAIAIVYQLTDDNTRKLLDVLSEWLGLEINYKRSGNRFSFTFIRPDGSEKTLEFEAGRVEPSDSPRVRVS